MSLASNSERSLTADGNRVQRSRTRTLNFYKCQRCRIDKQKCLPANREYPQKCDRCLQKGFDCSEPIKTDLHRKGACTPPATNTSHLGIRRSSALELPSRVIHGDVATEKNTPFYPGPPYLTSSSLGSASQLRSLRSIGDQSAHFDVSSHSPMSVNLDSASAVEGEVLKDRTPAPSRPRDTLQEPSFADHSERLHTSNRWDRQRPGYVARSMPGWKRNEQYMVAWICTTTTEYVAAQAFLDERHSPPEYVSSNDENDYTLGKMGAHSIVVAVLPKGAHSITSAASVARGILRTFHNIKFGLIVGIGGGAPSSKHDVRLGDIVVGTPYHRVIQYGDGKWVHDRRSITTGQINSPPTVLRSAVSSLEAQYELQGHDLEFAINRSLERNPRLKKKYGRPEPDTDRLYSTEWTHPVDNEASCAEVCDPSKIVRRKRRTVDDDDPAVHHGVVAFVNQVMRDPLLRDKFARENDILCFEMESAGVTGVLTLIPSLVIRGICDYSDTHKNKEWQGYAAMTAAAYAKDLLSLISTNKLEAMRTIGDVLCSVEPDADETQRNWKDSAVMRRQAELLRWLSPPDPSTNHNRALQQRLEGTGSWFLHSDAFASWRSQKASLLWLYGKPGCGKTILASTVIEHLQNLRFDPVLYFFFDFADAKKQTLQGVVCSLIDQLYHKCKSAQGPLDSLFSKCRNRLPSRESLCKVLKDMVEAADEVWMVLDSIDECAERIGGPTKGLLLWLQDLVGRKDNNLRCLVTSRLQQDIHLEMSRLTTEEHMISVQSGLIYDDISAYICAEVRSGECLRRWQHRPDVQKHIEETLNRRAQGMFRWVACQIEALGKCLDYPTLCDALDSLPETLDETYARMIQAIPVRQKTIVTRMLQFLTYSSRPLSIMEAADALAVDTETAPYFSPRNSMSKSDDIVRYSSKLVVIDSAVGPMKLQLAHLSVKEYLTSGQLDISMQTFLREPTARASIAEVCLAYLLHFDRVPPLLEIWKDFPFAQYCATYWMSHAQGAGWEGNNLLRLAEKFFCYQASSYQLCYYLYRPDELGYGELPSSIKIPALPVYYAAFGGLEEVLALLLEKGADVHAHGGYHGHALQAASYQGHMQIAVLLLDKGADVNAQGGYYGNALQAASYQGHIQVAILLLSKGADVNAQGGYYGNALQAASYQGHIQVAILLLSKGADVNAQGGYYSNALEAALDQGHLQMVELLLAKGAADNVRDGNYSSPLQAAAENGRLGMVELLLDKGVNINARGEYYRNDSRSILAGGSKMVMGIEMGLGRDNEKPFLDRSAGKTAHTPNNRDNHSLQEISAQYKEQVTQLPFDREPKRARLHPIH